jgi:ADP-heptose:LPS heptosyltransferase
MRVLVVKRDKLGDLLLATAVIAHLKRERPDAQVHLLANDYNAWVARDHPALARTWVYPRVKHAGRIRVGAAFAQLPLAMGLRAARFDWALVLGGDESHRAIRRAIATGARRVVAYAAAPDRYGRGLTDPLPVPSEGHEVARMAALLAPLGIAMPAPSLLQPAYHWPEARDPFVVAWLAQRDLAPDRYVVLGLGARRAKKQPTCDQIARWTTRIARTHGLPTVFMWTPGRSDNPDYPGDDDIAEPVLALQLPHLHAFRGPIPAALGLIANARTSLIPDSGLMHFAAASRGGVLGFFADPADSAPAQRWAPVGPRARWLEADRAVAELDDEQVMGALTPLL